MIIQFHAFSSEFISRTEGDWMCCTSSRLRWTQLWDLTLCLYKAPIWAKAASLIVGFDTRLSKSETRKSGLHSFGKYQDKPECIVSRSDEKCSWTSLEIDLVSRTNTYLDSIPHNLVKMVDMNNTDNNVSRGVTRHFLRQHHTIILITQHQLQYSPQFHSLIYL
jgi:hypothetical protein